MAGELFPSLGKCFWSIPVFRLHPCTLHKRQVHRVAAEK